MYLEMFVALKIEFNISICIYIIFSFLFTLSSKWWSCCIL